MSGRSGSGFTGSRTEGNYYDADGNRTSKTTPLGTIYYRYDSEDRLVSFGVTEEADTARLEYDEDGNLVSEATPTRDASYAYNAANRLSESHITEIRDGSRQTPQATVYAYDSFGRRILEADILNRWIRHTEYRGLTMDVWKNSPKKNDPNYFSRVGCKMTSAAKIISDATGMQVSLLDINNFDKNGDGLMGEDEIAEAFRSYLAKTDSGKELVTDYWEQQLSREKLDEITSSSEGTTYVLGRAEDVHSGQHWVVLTGYTVDESGLVQFNYSASSKNDVLKERKYILGDGNTKTETYRISKIETYTIRNKS